MTKEKAQAEGSLEGTSKVQQDLEVQVKTREVKALSLEDQVKTSKEKAQLLEKKLTECQAEVSKVRSSLIKFKENHKISWRLMDDLVILVPGFIKRKVFWVILPQKFKDKYW